MMTYMTKKAGIFLTILSSAVLLTGCFQSDSTVQLNPDRSAVIELDASFQTGNSFAAAFSDGTEQKFDTELLRSEILDLIEGSEGVDAWTSVTYERLDDGRIHLSGTLFVSDISKVELDKIDIPVPTITKSGEQFIMEFEPASTGSRKKKSADQIVDTATLTDEKVKSLIAQERRKFDQSKPIIEPFLSTMRSTARYSLNGTLVESRNITITPDGLLEITLDGKKFLEAMDAVMGDDALLESILRKDGTIAGSSPGINRALTYHLFGETGSIRAVFENVEPIAEEFSERLMAAKMESEALIKSLTPEEKAEPVAEPVSATLITDEESRITSTEVAEITYHYDKMPGYSRAEHVSMVIAATLSAPVLSVVDGTLERVETDGEEIDLNKEPGGEVSIQNVWEDGKVVTFAITFPYPTRIKSHYKAIEGRLIVLTATDTREFSAEKVSLAPGVVFGDLNAKIESVPDPDEQYSELEINFPLARERILDVRFFDVDGNRIAADESSMAWSDNETTVGYITENGFPEIVTISVTYYGVAKIAVPFQILNINGAGRKYK